MKTLTSLVFLLCCMSAAVAQEAGSADAGYYAGAPAIIYLGPVSYQGPVIYQAPVVYYAPVYYAPYQIGQTGSTPAACPVPSTVTVIGTGRGAYSYSNVGSPALHCPGASQVISIGGGR